MALVRRQAHGLRSDVDGRHLLFLCHAVRADLRPFRSSYRWWSSCWCRFGVLSAEILRKTRIYAFFIILFAGGVHCPLARPDDDAASSPGRCCCFTRAASGWPGGLNAASGVASWCPRGKSNFQMPLSIWLSAVPDSSSSSSSSSSSAAPISCSMLRRHGRESHGRKNPYIR